MSAVARIVVVVTAVAAIVLLVAWQRDSEMCHDSVKDLLFTLRDREPDPEIDAAITAIEDDCEGSDKLVDAGGVLLQQREPEHAAPSFRIAAEREPESFSAWAGLALALQPEDPAAAAEAARRAQALNRFYRPPS